MENTLPQPGSVCCARPVDVRAAFARHNLRLTKQRADVYQTLAACRCHPTAEQLHRMVSQHAPGTSLATIYNTLEVLLDAGMCRRIPTNAGSRYDADMRDHLHVVTPDGQLIDVHADDPDTDLAELPARLRDTLARRLGLRLSQVSVHIHADTTATTPAS